jgi:hypothetical protein
LLENSEDLTPARSLSGFCCFANYENEEMRKVLRTIGPTVRASTDNEAEGGEELNEERGDVRLSVRFDCSHNPSGEAMKGFGAEWRWCLGLFRTAITAPSHEASGSPLVGSHQRLTGQSRWTERERDVPVSLSPHVFQ